MTDTSREPVQNLENFEEVTKKVRDVLLDYWSDVEAESVNLEDLHWEYTFCSEELTSEDEFIEKRGELFEQIAEVLDMRQFTLTFEEGEETRFIILFVYMEINGITPSLSIWDWLKNMFGGGDIGRWW